MSSATKRPRDPVPVGEGALLKRARMGGGTQGAGSSSKALVEAKSASQKVTAVGKKREGAARTSDLAAPTMLLTGHQDAVFTCKFNKQGTYIASGSKDRLILLWNVYGECKNFAMLKGHKSAVLDLCWSRDDVSIYSASADATVTVWDVESGTRVRKLRDHSDVVHSVCAARHESSLVSGSDDGCAHIWDARTRGAEQTLSHPYQITAVAFSEDAKQVFTGGIDEDIHVWERRKAEKPVYSLSGHGDTISCLRLSPDGSFLLSNALDRCVKQWDIRPYVRDASRRLVNNFIGSQHDFQKLLIKCAWSADGARVGAGSSDRCVYVWDAVTRRLEYKLPGHKGAVTEVDFHPKARIMVSCSMDRTLYLGELAK